MGRKQKDKLQEEAGDRIGGDFAIGKRSWEKTEDDYKKDISENIIKKILKK